MKRTKIVATIGPACDSVETLKRLILAGADAARINFSHGTHETHTIMVEKLKQAREELGIPVALMLDTKGPEIRIRTFAEDKVRLEQGQIFTLTTEDIIGDSSRVSVSYAELPEDVVPGGIILIDDGLIELRVLEINGPEIKCEVKNGGFLSARKGVNVPGVYVNLPTMTEQDKADIIFGINMGFDYLAASFVRSAGDIETIRAFLEKNGGGEINIIAKIETREAVKNIEEILDASDGIMVARGDLGVEIPTEDVPVVQKHLIKRANLMGKIVITATQMLESMVNNPRPTRAEASDVANAIYDGTDCVMLSGESANGKYPVESVETMARIAVRIEDAINYGERFRKRRGELEGITNAISHACCTTAADLSTPCIVTVTNSGFTARMVSRFRPLCPVVAVTTKETTYRRLSLVWGCAPVLSKEEITDVYAVAAQKAHETGFAKKGDAIVIVGGFPVGVSGTTNTLKVEIV